MTRPCLLIAAAFAVIAGLPGSSHGAAADDAASIMERSDARTKSHTEATLYDMELVDPQGKTEQTRSLEVFFKRYPDREVTLQKFLSPPILEDTGMMIEDTGAVTNDIWFYLPSTRRLRRISGAEKSNWYMGTQFTYEDFEDYNLDAYGFTLNGEETCGEGSKCWVIEAVATAEAEKKASGYSAKVYWIEQESLYPVRVDYVGKEGGEVKRLTTSGLRRIDEYWRPDELVMKDLGSGRSTRLLATKREIDQPLDDYKVSNRYLRKD